MGVSVKRRRVLVGLWFGVVKVDGKWEFASREVFGEPKRPARRGRNGVWYWRDPEGEGWAYTVRRYPRIFHYAGFKTKRQAMRGYREKWRYRWQKPSNFNR